MGESKHTPGPWQVDRAMGSGSYVRSGTGVLVASCYWMNDQNEVPAPANARLIAAAPDMYEALSRMVALYDSGAWSNHNIADARAALAKAGA